MWNSLTFPSPFCYTLNVELVNYYCYNCLKKLSTHKESVVVCKDCRFAKFCHPDCRDKAKPWHDEECSLLQSVYPQAPHTLVLFYSRLVRYLRKAGIKINEEETSRSIGFERKWAHLMTHMDFITKNPQNVASCEILHEMTMQFLRNTYEISKEEFLYMFCKKNINSYGIFNNFGVMIGEAMDFKGSCYDHSCRPTIGISFHGIEMTFRSLELDLDLKDLTKAFVSYTELAQSKFKRKKELKEKYYFDCQCDRCLDPEDDTLVSIRCENKNCDEPIVFFEDKLPEDTMCTKCGTKIPKESLERGLTCVSLIVECINQNNVSESGLELYNTCSLSLHPLNVYLADLGTSYLQECLVQRQNLLSAFELGQKSTNCLRMCYPKYHKSLAFHLLKLAYTNVLNDDLDNVYEYVKEALSILQIWFGKEYSTCGKLESLLEKMSSKSNWIVSSDLLKYFKFE